MTRRESFIASAAGLLGLAIAPLLPKGIELRACGRFDYQQNKWITCRMFQLKKGDCFRLDEVGTFVAADDPKKHENGIWGINARWELDEKTNQWVDA